MWSLDPSSLVNWSEERLLHEGYMHGQKSRMEFALKNANALPSTEALASAVEFIAEAARIDISTEQLASILSLYPIHRGKLADYGWGDTEVEELCLDVVANFFAGSRWPIGTDQVDIQAFTSRLQIAAQFMGYGKSEKA